MKLKLSPKTMLKVVSTMVLVVTVGAITAGLSMTATSAAPGDNQGHCGEYTPEAGYAGKLEKNDSGLYEFTYSQPIVSVFIKAGSTQSTTDSCMLFTANGVTANGCYTISGLGTDTVTIVNNKTNDPSLKECKDISHIEYYFAVEVTVTPTSTPVATTTVVPTTTVAPTATPIVTTVVPTTVVTLTVAPTATPTVSVVPTTTVVMPTNVATTTVAPTNTVSMTTPVATTAPAQVVAVNTTSTVEPTKTAEVLGDSTSVVEPVLVKKPTDKVLANTGAESAMYSITLGMILIAALVALNYKKLNLSFLK
jgi:hypothetical protein